MKDRITVEVVEYLTGPEYRIVARGKVWRRKTLAGLLAILDPAKITRLR